MSNSIYDKCLNIITLGNSGVGKTQIINKYSRNSFDIKTMATIGIEFSKQTIQLPDPENNNEKVIIRMSISDTAGQEKYRSVCYSYYKRAQGILFVYDVTDRSSFEQLDVWMKQVKEHMGSEQQIRIMLIGNKSDLIDERQVSYEEGETLAILNNMPFYETSALNGTNIKEAFEKLCSDMLTIDSIKFTRESLRLNKPKTTSCCSTKKKRK